MRGKIIALVFLILAVCIDFAMAADNPLPKLDVCALEVGAIGRIPDSHIGFLWRAYTHSDFMGKTNIYVATDIVTGEPAIRLPNGAILVYQGVDTTDTAHFYCIGCSFLQQSFELYAKVPGVFWLTSTSCLIPFSLSSTPNGQLSIDISASSTK